MYRIGITILVFVSLLGCASVPAQRGSGALDEELKSDIRTCEKGLFTSWRASTRFVSNNDTILVLCEYTTEHGDDKIWDCIWNPKDKHYECRYKQSRIQISKDHIPTNPSQRYDLFCGPCVGGWQQ